MIEEVTTIAPRQDLAMEILAEGAAHVAATLEDSTVSTTATVDIHTMSYAAVIVARHSKEQNPPRERLMELITLACGGSALVVLDAFFRKVGVSPEEIRGWATDLTRLIMEQLEGHMDEVIDRLAGDESTHDLGGQHATNSSN